MQDLMKTSILSLAVMSGLLLASGALAANGPDTQALVWLEKGTHKLNVDSKGVILKAMTRWPISRKTKR
jgi:hypothetical protein